MRIPTRSVIRVFMASIGHVCAFECHGSTSVQVHSYSKHAFECVKNALTCAKHCCGVSVNTNENENIAFCTLGGHACIVEAAQSRCVCGKKKEVAVHRKCAALPWCSMDTEHVKWVAGMYERIQSKDALAERMLAIENIREIMVLGKEMMEREYKEKSVRTVMPECIYACTDIALLSINTANIDIVVERLSKRDSYVLHSVLRHHMDVLYTALPESVQESMHRDVVELYGDRDIDRRSVHALIVPSVIRKYTKASMAHLQSALDDKTSARRIEAARNTQTLCKMVCTWKMMHKKETQSTVDAVYEMYRCTQRNSTVRSQIMHRDTSHTKSGGYVSMGYTHKYRSSVEGSSTSSVKSSKSSETRSSRSMKHAKTRSTARVSDECKTSTKQTVTEEAVIEAERAEDVVVEAVVPTAPPMPNESAMAAKLAAAVSERIMAEEAALVSQRAERALQAPLACMVSEYKTYSNSIAFDEDMREAYKECVYGALQQSGEDEKEAALSALMAYVTAEKQRVRMRVEVEGYSRDVRAEIVPVNTVVYAVQPNRCFFALKTGCRRPAVMFVKDEHSSVYRVAKCTGTKREGNTASRTMPETEKRVYRNITDILDAIIRKIRGEECACSVNTREVRNAVPSTSAHKSASRSTYEYTSGEYVSGRHVSDRKKEACGIENSSIDVLDLFANIVSLCVVTSEYNDVWHASETGSVERAMKYVMAVMMTVGSTEWVEEEYYSRTLGAMMTSTKDRQRLVSVLKDIKQNIAQMIRECSTEAQTQPDMQTHAQESAYSTDNTDRTEEVDRMIEEVKAQIVDEHRSNMSRVLVEDVKYLDSVDMKEAGLCCSRADTVCTVPIHEDEQVRKSLRYIMGVCIKVQSKKQEETVCLLSNKLQCGTLVVHVNE